MFPKREIVLIIDRGSKMGITPKKGNRSQSGNYFWYDICGLFFFINYNNIFTPQRKLIFSEN